MPESPHEIRLRLLERGLSDRDVDILVIVDSHRDVGIDGDPGQGIIAYFDALAGIHDAKVVVNWLTNELLGQLTLRSKSFKDNTISIRQLSDLIQMVQGGQLTGNAGKTLLRHMLDRPSSETVIQLAQDLSLVTIRNESLEQICKQVVASMPSEVKAFRKGNLNVLNKMVGSVMKASRGTANAQNTKALLESILQSEVDHT